MKECILVSSCILGSNTKYNGGNNYRQEIEEIKKLYTVIPICPEATGGLLIPRHPSEIIGNKVINNIQEDVTIEYQRGAKIALDLALQYDCKIAILKESSPSCGSNFIYDGTFSGKKIPGKGITAKVLEEHGITIYNETNFIELLK